MTRHILVLLVVCTLAISCTHKQPQSGQIESVDSTTIPSYIKLQTVELQSYSPQFRTVGTVAAQNGKIANIAAPFDGRITASYVHIGQKVVAGQPIFLLNSNDYLEVVKEYFQAQSDYALAQKNYQRKRNLHENGIASARELEEAEAEESSALKELERITQYLHIFNVNADNLNMGDPLKVVSPIAGEVVACNITTGNYITADSEPVATIADLNEVWVKAQVKEHYIGSVQAKDKVQIITDADPQQPIEGEVYYVGELLDEQTRSVEVIVACHNQDRKLKPGMFTSVVFQSAPQQVLLVPSTAVFQAEDNAYLYVADEKGHFTHRYIQVRDAGNSMLIVTHGLQAGETIVADGGLYIEG